MACALKNIRITGACRTGSAGIARLFLIPEEDLASVNFSSDQEVDGYTLETDKKWYEIEFEQEGTGFFNQTLTSGKNTYSWAFEINVTIPLNSNDLRDKFNTFLKCCNMVAVIEDNQDQIHVVGIEWKSGTTAAVYKKRNLKVGNGTWNTGAALEDSNELVFSLVAQGAESAHYGTDALVTSIESDLAADV